MSDEVSESDRAAVRFPPPLVGVLIILVGYGLERVIPLVAAPTVSSVVRYGVGGFIVATSVAVLGVWPTVLRLSASSSELAVGGTSRLLLLFGG